MGRKTIFQLVGAIISGIYTAVSLAIASAGLWPNVSWQIHALIGLMVFVIAMCWIIYDKQSKINVYESRRPELTLGKTVGAHREINKHTSTIKIELILFFKNIGAKAAYQFRSRVGFAPDNAPKQFELLDEKTSVNRIDPNNEFEIGQTLSSTVKYKEKDGNKVVSPIYTLIHCSVSYSDSSSNGKWFKDEWWFSYRADRPYLGMLSKEKKDELEPYVREAYKQLRPSQ